MDDMSLMSSSVAGARDLLSRCTTALACAGMSYKAHKFCSIVIIKGRSINSTPFSIKNPSTPKDFSNFIPSIHSQPVKFLGRIIDGSLSDRKSISELEKKLLSGLKIIDRSLFKGAQKLWILQHFLVPRIQWPLMIYKISMSAASNLEKKILTYIRKWLGLHSSSTNIAFILLVPHVLLQLKN